MGVNPRPSAMASVNTSKNAGVTRYASTEYGVRSLAIRALFSPQPYAPASTDGWSSISGMTYRGAISPSGWPLSPMLRSMNRLSGRSYGRSRSSTALRTLKIAVLAPMPRASVTTMIALVRPFLMDSRRACRTSRTSVSRPKPGRAARSASLICARPPSSWRARRSASSSEAPRARYFSRAIDR
jgi:hypothetical protein